MALSTAEAIRDRIYTLIEGLTPASDATKFRRYRNEWGADFIAAAEANPAAMLRRFQIREVSDDEPPITTGVIEERVTVRYQVLVAYPQSHRYGRDGAADRDDVMNEDWKAINFKVGIYGRGNFSTTTNGSYDATPLGAVRDMERGDGVDLLVIDVPFEFYRATGVEAAADEDPVTVTRDATSNIAVPADSDEWAIVLSDAGYSALTPSHVFSMQEASGALADGIGALSLSASGSVLYQQAVSGWTRKAIGTTNGTGGKWSTASGTGPNPGIQSVAYLVYALVTAPNTERGFAFLSDASSHLLQTNVTTAGLFRQYVNSGGVSSASGQTLTGSVRPVLVVFNRTASTAMMYTDLNKTTAVYNAGVTDGNKGFGHATVPPTARYLYGAWWSGAAAEMSDAAAKVILETLGWMVSWS